MAWVSGTVEASLKAISESSRLEGEVCFPWTRSGIRHPRRIGGGDFYFTESSWISWVWKVYPNFRDVKMGENMTNDDWRMPLTARHTSTPETLKSREVCNSEIQCWYNSHRALGLVNLVTEVHRPEDSSPHGVLLPEAGSGNCCSFRH